MTEIVTSLINNWKNLLNSGILPLICKIEFWGTLIYFTFSYINHKLIADNNINKRLKKIISSFLWILAELIGGGILVILVLSIYLIYLTNWDIFFSKFKYDFLLFILAFAIMYFSGKENLDTINIFIKKIKTFFDAIFLFESEKINDELKKRLNVSN